MVLRYYGRAVRLDTVRDHISTERDGTNAKAILQCGAAFGLRGRGVALDIDELPFLPRGAILHWGFNHFVVFESLKRKAVDIVDPIAGRRRVPLAQFRQLFTGVAVLLEPGVEFSPQEDERTGLTWELVRNVLRDLKWQAIQVLLATALIQAGALALPFLLKTIVDRVIPRSDVNLLQILALAVAGVVLFLTITSIARGILLSYLRTQVDQRLMSGFLEHLVSLPYGFFQKRSAGDLMMRLSSAATIRATVTGSALTSVLDATLATLYLIVLLSQSLILGLLVAGIGAVQVVTFLLSRRAQRQLMTRDLEAQVAAQAFQVQMFSGIETLKASGAERRAVELWANLFASVVNTTLARGRLSARVDGIGELVRVGGPAVILAFGAHLVVSGALSLGTMLALVTIAVAFLTPLSTLVAIAAQFSLLGSFVDRLEDVFAAAPEQGVRSRRVPRQISGHVRLQDITYRYSPAAQPVISDVSFEIRPGERVAIVGPSGAGKSTLVKLLLGLLRAESGQVLHDGEPIDSFDMQDLRRRIGTVMQHPYLFNATIRENIAFGSPDATLEHVTSAARLAHIHEDVMAMPMGYDTVILDGGTSISGGQRQRIALARALLQRPRLLLLDEATSHLDSETEAKVHGSLSSLGCSQLIIAHRLSTVADAATIVVLNGGRVVEAGSHASLLRNNGRYADLLCAQNARLSSAEASADGNLAH